MTLVLLLFIFLSPCKGVEIEIADSSVISATVQSISENIMNMVSTFNETSAELLSQFEEELEESTNRSLKLDGNLTGKIEARMQQFNLTVAMRLSVLEKTLETSGRLLSEYKEALEQNGVKNKQQDGYCDFSMEIVPIGTLSYIMYDPSGSESDLMDIAEDKPTYASHHFRGIQSYTSENAVDDDARTFFASDQLLNPWWVVDLMSQETISKIVVLTRQDCCSSRFHDVEIRFGNELQLDGNFISYKLLYFFRGPYERRLGTLACQFPTGVKGRYLSIQIINIKEFLQLNTVKVFAKRKDVL